MKPLLIQLEITTKRKTLPIPMIFKIDTGANNELTFHNGAVEHYRLVESVNKRIKTRSGFGVDLTMTRNRSFLVLGLFGLFT